MVRILRHGQKFPDQFKEFLTKIPESTQNNTLIHYSASPAFLFQMLLDLRVPILRKAIVVEDRMHGAF